MQIYMYERGGLEMCYTSSDVFGVLRTSLSMGAGGGQVLWRMLTSGPHRSA